MTDQQQQSQQAQQPQPQQQQVQPQPQQQQVQPQPPLISFNTTAPKPPQIPASYQSIIDQQNEQIAALMAQNQALNGQITQMVQNGAQFAKPVMQPQPAPQQTYQPMQTQPAQQFPNYYDGNNVNQFNPASLASDADYSLEGLAEQIGKKE